MKPGFLVSIILAMCVVLTAGCGALDARSQADKLEQSLTQYSAAIRWSRHREAIGFHVTRDGKFTEVNIDHLEKFGVTGFEYLSKRIVPNLDVDGVTEAIIVSEVSYFHKEQGTVRKLKLNQIWWYNKKIKRWLVETDFPEFK